MTTNPIKKAIVSVFDKSYLNLLAEYFLNFNINVFSTGGTSKFLKSFSSKIKVIDISDFTKFNEILGGRVKSLHPIIHSGILAKKNSIQHQKELTKLKIPNIDLVVVNLYPFEIISENPNSSDLDCIENIDIGGPTLLRGAAKNYEKVTVLSDPDQYKKFLKEVKKNNNSTGLSFRKACAKTAFDNTAFYDSKISSWFNGDQKNLYSEKGSIPIKKISDLRYGENPHQKASVFKFSNNEFLKISGKELSYNNICDTEVAIELAGQFSKPSCVILKHGNPCGVALDNKQDIAYSKALKCDKTSAFGGIIAFNKVLTLETAKKINNIFTEVVIAPKFSKEAKNLLSLKQNLILIEYKNKQKITSTHIKTTRNFLLIQEKDNKKINIKNLKTKTEIKPTSKCIDDLLFAFTISKYINSNAIVLVNNLSTVGIGVGQTSRLDSAKQAIKKMKNNFKNTKSVMASDGFFPFSDIVTLCSKNNVAAIIQPGGSKNDNDVITTANKFKIPLVFTGTRHFKH